MAQRKTAQLLKKLGVKKQKPLTVDEWEKKGMILKEEFHSRHNEDQTLKWKSSQVVPGEYTYVDDDLDEDENIPYWCEDCQEWHDE